MKGKNFILIAACAAFFTMHSAEAALGFLKRGLKHCTGVCDQSDLCEFTPEKDKKFKWCLKNCSHKMDVKGMCEEAGFPLDARPILSYEKFSGSLNTNHITPISLSALDMTFIKQTTDRRRLMGIVKGLLLVHQQYVKGSNIQKLSQEKREVLADKLLRKFFKKDPVVFKTYDATGFLEDGVIAVLFDNLKGQILSKFNK
ncbi:MAG: hypothetical protein GY915_08455 [bacterium]|nr:hypothetical protein [bacterium]